jgi:hypothetical protein
LGDPCFEEDTFELDLIGKLNNINDNLKSICEYLLFLATPPPPAKPGAGVGVVTHRSLSKEGSPNSYSSIGLSNSKCFYSDQICGFAYLFTKP